MYSFVVTITDDAGMPYQEHWSADSIEDATNLVVLSLIPYQGWQSITVESVS